MNVTLPQSCTVTTYLNLCSSSKVLLLVPGFTLNIFLLVSLLSSLLAPRAKIRGNVAVFILGISSCNLLSLCLWPLILHWRMRGRWLLGPRLCEAMVSVKQMSSLASFHYASFVAFSVYLTVVCGCGRLVDSRLFLALELLSPLLPGGLKELGQWFPWSRVHHLDPVEDSCFSFLNDPAMRTFALVKTAALLPLNLYFYAHVLHTVVQSAKASNRSQRGTVTLARMFSLISLITFSAHVPGAAFSLMDRPSVCQEMVRDVLLDLPLISSPVILFCMNKELRNQGLLILRCKVGMYERGDTSVKWSQSLRSLTNGESVVKTQ
ncbi:uncharacterized protein LOC132465466 [Gadus macrocephalus]|uniref:uncharacterized protein LOC132465466 n=1 Tax=Gadus macrocephalus TaxID=80720 RepID=UPI0028CB4EA9|nr:uncharacterized protein LOC132465466 [Gadus macrocephalus]